MPTLLWDASALIKRNTLEAGSDTVDALFVAAAQVQMVATYWGYAETFACLRCSPAGEQPHLLR